MSFGVMISLGLMWGPWELTPYSLCVALFLLLLGGVIGSFLNVVIFRLPAGVSIVHPRSRCPSCASPIRALDNLPVLGWLKLRGRCRDCGTRISIRYPLVELATALMFVVLGLAEPLSDGANLPTLPVRLGEMVAVLSSTQLWGLYAYHLVLLCALLVAAGIEHDGHRLPRRLVVAVFAAGLLPPVWCPYLHPLAAEPELARRLHDYAWSAGLITAIVGGAVGLILGCLASPATGEGRSRLEGRTTALVALGWTGVFLGWQAVEGIAVVVSALFLMLVMYRRGWAALRLIPYSGCISAASLSGILGWNAICANFPRLGQRADQLTLAAAAIVVLVMSTTTWLFRDRPDELKADEQPDPPQSNQPEPMKQETTS
jgi:leader peptidase (prepilin peptidase)/N-methyltransferase